VRSSEEVRNEGSVERNLRRLHQKGVVVQLGRSGPRKPLRAWKLGKDLSRAFLEGRR